MRKGGYQKRLPVPPFRLSIKNASTGFTLVELVIVLTLILVLMAMAFPHINALLDKYRLQGASTLVWGDLQYARVMAIKENRSLRVDFHSTSYSIVQVDTGAVRLTRDLSGEYPGINVSKSGGGSVQFDFTGMTATATVNLQGPAGAKTIFITWTGGIQLN